MYEHPALWRKKIRLQILADIANDELKSGKEFEEFKGILEQEMQQRWNLVSSTRQQYLEVVKKILNKEFVVNTRFTLN